MESENPTYLRQFSHFFFLSFLFALFLANKLFLIKVSIFLYSVSVLSSTSGFSKLNIPFDAENRKKKNPEYVFKQWNKEPKTWSRMEELGECVAAELPQLTYYRLQIKANHSVA